MPRVSVLMPVYNCESYINKAIESVLDQTFQDFELIVVNDGSFDKSGEIASSYPQVRYFDRPHKGIPETRNFAVSKAEGELITFLDADDLWAPEKLEHQVRYLDEHPDCYIIFCRYQNFSDIPEDEMTEKQRKLLGREIDKCLTAACMRKSLFDRIGDFSLTCPYGEDTEWSARLVLAGVDISKRLEEFLYLRRIHNDNITLAHNETDNQAFYSSLADSIRMKLRKGGLKK